MNEVKDRAPKASSADIAAKLKALNESGGSFDLSNSITNIPPKPKEPRPVFDDALLISRQDTARLLGNVHVATVIRKQNRGELTPVRLNPHLKNSRVFYRRAEIMALIERGQAETDVA